MDNYDDFASVFSSQSNGEDISSPSSPTELRVDDLRLLRIDSWEKIERLQALYTSVEIPGKQDTMAFMRALVEDRNAWFVEAGEVGLIYLTEIFPGFTAVAHAIFWDRKLSADRREAIKTVLATAFSRFDLQRISTLVPSKLDRLSATWTKCGFVHEGTIRKGWFGDNSDDALLFGLLREEQVWPVATIPATSLG